MKCVGWYVLYEQHYTTKIPAFFPPGFVTAHNDDDDDNCWDRNRPFLNCSHKGTKDYTKSLGTEAFRVPLTRTRIPSSVSEKQVHTTLLHQTLRSPRRSMIGHFRNSTALESTGVMLYTTVSPTLHCSMWCVAWMQLLGLKIHSMKRSLHCSGANLKDTWCLDVCY